MVRIQNIDEFKRILESNFGFVIISGEIPKFHKPSCELLNTDDFINSDTNGKEFHWFSTIFLAEKEFPNNSFCQKCNPSP